jgi:hypothetical protein
MKILRGVLGVLFGFGIFVVLVQMMSAFTGILTSSAPGDYLVLSITWTVAAAVVSGYITSLIAGAHEFPHAAAVGLLMIGMSLLSMRAEGSSKPGWYQIAIAGCGPISALIGAAIRLLTKPDSTTKGQIANSNTHDNALN